MATAKSVTFQTDKDTLFATAIQIIQGAGYIISETNDAARKIVYYADKPFLPFNPAGRFEVTITVSGASQTATSTALLNIKVVGITLHDWGIGVGKHIIENSKFETSLIDFCINELGKQFQIAVTTITSSNAPGAGGKKGGCLVILAFLGSLAAVSGLGCLAFLLPYLR